MLSRLYPERYSPRWQYGFVAVLYAAMSVTAVLVILFLVQFLQSRMEARNAAQLDVWDKAADASPAVDNWFFEVQQSIELIAAAVVAGEGGSLMVDRDLPNLFRDVPGIRAAGFYAQPTDTAAEPRLTVYRRESDSPADYIGRRSEEDAVGLVRVGERYFPHYLAAASPGARWIDPILDEDTGLRFVPFIAPVAFPNAARPGVEFIFAEVSVGSLSNIFEWLVLGEVGYQVLADRSMNVAEHPDATIAAGRQRLSDVTGISQQRLDRLTEISSDDEVSLVSYSNELDGQDSLITLHRLNSTGFYLAYVAFESQVLARSQATKQALMRLSAAALAFLFFTLILVTRSYAGSLGGLWALALLTGILFSAGILVIWYLFANTPASTEPDRTDLADAIKAHKEFLAENYGLDSIDIRAGIALTSVDFTKLGSTIANADEAIVSGFMWWDCLNCDSGVGRDTGGGDNFGGIKAPEPGFLLPGAREVEFVPRLSYRDGLGNTRVDEFTAIISRDFKPAQYPFDTDNVSLRIWPIDFDLPILLIPDLADYRSLDQTVKPGLATDFRIAGWNTEGTFFSYDVVDYNTTFGMQEEVGTDNSTELLFNISVRRNFINAFITNVLPIVIITILLFHVLLITPKTEKYALAFAGGPKSRGSGDPPQGAPTYTLIAVSMTMAYTSALFFAVILAHSRLRNEIPADGILYLEYFYFAAYFAILAVTMNVLAFAAHRGGWLVHFRDNLIPRAAYWPLVTLFLFTVTFVTFY